MEDLTQSLKDAENALRDFIAATLEEKLGEDWVSKCGVSADRIQRWQDRKMEEEKRQRTGTADERILYYADFYDIPKILKTHWGGTFSEVFGDWKTMEVFIDQLQALRDPDAHRREMLPHQKQLAAGISGTIRSQIARYRSSKENADAYFPRIESVRDSLGTIWTYGGRNLVQTKKILRVGDKIEFVITASHPHGDDLLYSIAILNGYQKLDWREAPDLTITLTDNDINRNLHVVCRVRGKSPTQEKLIDHVSFVYTVLPAL